MKIMTMELSDEAYMRRALELAALGEAHASPNPMVGAVIVAPDGRIIGEGWHRRCGGPHAEVNAVASVANPDELRTATMYVTLEPCSHWGRTPPCAKLIIDKQIPRVVVAASDPFPAVSGRGIAMLREAGVEVRTGVLAEESRRLNARFITAHTEQRPFVVLKWAQSADGFMDRRRESPEAEAARHPLPDARLWPGGDAPRPVVLDRRGRVPADARIHARNPLVLTGDTSPRAVLHTLYAEHGITSLLVEGGPAVLRSFIDAGAWDVARVEVAPERFGADGVAPAPCIPAVPARVDNIDGRRIYFYSKNTQVDVKNL